jgi:REP element-mobilizing transposase RayT
LHSSIARLNSADGQTPSHRARGGLYQVTSRGDRREAIYRDDADRTAWLDLLGDVCERFNWRCHAYCQMTSHYHVVVETPEANLSQGMRQLNGVYTQSTNRRLGLVGHLYQGRFKAILVERDAYLLELMRCVVLNPVCAGLVQTADDWAWSSCRAMVGQASAPAWLEADWLLAQFGEERASAQAGYADFVRQGVGGASIWEGLRHQVFLGSEGLAGRHRATTKPLERLREVPRAQRRALAEPLAGLARRYPDRAEAMARAFGTGVYTMQEIATFFGVHCSPVSRAVRRFQTKPGFTTPTCAKWQGV